MCPWRAETASLLKPKAAVLSKKIVSFMKEKCSTVLECTLCVCLINIIKRPYVINFSPWNPSVCDALIEKMLSHKKKLDEHHDKSLQVTEFQCLNSNVQRTCKLSFLCLQEEEEETENQWFFLDLSETWDYKETCYPEICRDKQIQRVTDEICLPGAEAVGAINW